MPTLTLDDAFGSDSVSLALPGGAPLAKAGEMVEGLYRLLAGRMAEVEPMAEGGGRLVAVLKPGALIGGAQLLGDGRFRTTITALRDSELQMISADRAEVLMREQPAILAEIARAALERLREPEPADRRQSRIIGLIALGGGVEMRALAERLGAAMRLLGADVAVVGSEADKATPSYIHALEVENDFVLMAAEHGEADFAGFCGRQIDRLVLVARGDDTPPEGEAAGLSPALRREKLIDLILMQPPEARRPRRTGRWTRVGPAARLFHVREGSVADLDRLARVYTGNSVGLALSGGGARAYAHVGAIKALRELHVPIDFVAGTSMGAVIAAGVAMGWDEEEMDQRLREAFVESSPLADVAFPVVAMTRGRRVEQRLRAHFDDVQICDLWRPFFCVSTDLTVGRAHIHRIGSLRRALRASLSLPGVLPPVVEAGHVLVDGALTRNLPADLVCELHDGVTLAVNAAAPSQGLKPEDLALHPSGVRWLTSGAWRKGPPIVAVLIRAATMPSRALRTAEPNDRVLEIVPDVGKVSLQDWKAYDEAVADGYAATMAMADQLAMLSR